MSVNKNIQRIRRKKDMTLDDVAEHIGVSKSTVARYESGDIKYIPVKKLELIAEALGCSVDDLIKDDPRYTDNAVPDPFKNQDEFDMDLFRRYSLLSEEKKIIVRKLIDGLEKL